MPILSLKPFHYTLEVACVLTCLMLLYSLSFQEKWVTTLPSEASRKNNTGAGTVIRERMNVPQGNVKRVLKDGRLPLDSTDNTSRSLWGSDPPGSQCSDYKTRFGKHLPRVWLASYPGSGNTWTRYLLEGASGVFTGSLYNDKRMEKKGFLGEKDRVGSMRTLVQKTHFPLFEKKGHQGNNFTIPTIVLLRNPERAIISFYKLQKSKSQTAQIPDTVFQEKGFHRFVEIEIWSWMKMNLDRLKQTKAPLYVMHYERLVKNPLEELTALLAFLGVPLDEGRMACIASHLEGKVKRKGNSALDPYTSEEKANMATATASVNKTLQMMGYSPLPTYH